MYLLNNFKALGTLCFIEVFDQLSLDKMHLISKNIENEILNFEKFYSRFDNNSLISKLNQNRSLLNPSKELIGILELSEKYNRLTNGIFDIKLGKVLSEKGYGEVRSLKSFCENQEIRISSNLIELKGDFEIDLGGIGKSYLIDKIAKILVSVYKIKYFLINFGGDIYLTSDNEEPIEIYLENPINTNNIIKPILCKNRAICGSSPHKRVWFDKQGIKQTHIISPENKKVNYSSFVFAPNVIDADVFATSLCIDPLISIEDEQVTAMVFDEKGALIRVK